MEGECKALFEVNAKEIEESQPLHRQLTPQALSLESVCLVNGSWTLRHNSVDVNEYKKIL